MSYNNEIIKSAHCLYKMLISRNFKEDQLTDLLALTKNTINDQELRMQKFSIDLHDIKTHIVYDTSDKFKCTSFIRQYLDNIENINDYGIFIIVIAGMYNPSDIAKIEAWMIQHDMQYQTFALDDLQFDIAEHYLVPKHELIDSANDIAEILKKYCLTSKTQLPWILKTDPMSKYYFAKPGNIMKITRVSPTSGIDIVYRIVI